MITPRSYIIIFQYFGCHFSHFLFKISVEFHEKDFSEHAIITKTKLMTLVVMLI